MEIICPINLKRCTYIGCNERVCQNIDLMKSLSVDVLLKLNRNTTIDEVIEYLWAKRNDPKISIAEVVEEITKMKI